jgi:hypothetical protein
MIKYVPFLKLKGNEIRALGSLSADVSSQVIPFFDSPKKRIPDDKTVEDVFKKDTLAAAKSAKKHLSSYDEFYVDNFDIDDLIIDEEHSYTFFLKCFDEHPVIPVVGIDRTPEYIQAIIDLKNSGQLSSDILAFRITAEDFVDYSIVSLEIEDQLENLFSLFDEIDLIFDCRVCSNLNASDISTQTEAFASAFRTDYQSLRKTILTGSTIPASVKEILSTDSDAMVTRNEIAIYLVTSGNGSNFVFGDYTVISPEFSDVQLMPEMMQNVMAPKFIYSTHDRHYFIRGKSLKPHGYGQYFDLADTLCSHFFFRGEAYSEGDQYLYEKSQGLGNNCTPSALVKPLIISHITYMINDFLT